MATGTAPHAVPTAPPVQDRKTAIVIERQLRRARFHVKLVDLLCQGALLVIGVLIFLLLAALLDHWVMPGGLGFIGRALALTGLLALAGWFLVRNLGPLILRAINPTYAARAIEEAQPSLKNSLINFLLLRHDRSGIRDAVFDAVEQKAAADIATVHVGSAVDRTPMIRVGYVLVGVMAICAAYKILSPKDPFQTAARVALPWADIARPSRVQILEVTPGDAKVYHGHTIEVTATIEGGAEDSPVWLIYSTADGQTVDRKLRMKAGPGGIQFKGQLPEDEDAPAIKPGLQQDVIYRVEAGDALSQNYRLSVVAAPTIVIQQLELDFPPYTGKPRQVLDRQGDIQAIEGTKVTIHALANQPIQLAFLELDPNDSAQGAAEIVPLTFDGQKASGSIVLQLGKDRVTPWHTSYQVRFLNEEGHKSEQPIRHQLDVRPDLSPELQILAPTEQRIEVPANGSRPIEARAIDPDFGLTRLAIEGEVAGKKVLTQELLKEDGTHPPQTAAKFIFRPQEHGLKEGDELTYVAIAADNRESAPGQPEPNVATTRPQVIVIVAPEQQQPNPDQPPPNAEQQPMDENRDPAGDQPPMPKNDRRQQPNTQDREQQPNSDQPMRDEPKEGSEEVPMQGGQKSDQQKDKGKNDGGKGQKGQSQRSKGGGKDEQGGQKSDSQPTDQGDMEEGSEGTKGQSQPGGAKGDKSSGSPQQENPADGAPGSEKSDGGSKGSPSGNSSEPSGQEGGQSQDQSGDPTGASEQPTRPAHDGDAIERILEHRRENQGDSDPSDSQGSDQTGQPREGTQDATAGEKQDQGSKAKESDAAKSDGEGTKADGEKSKSDGAKGEKGTEKMPMDGGADAQGDDAQGENAAGQKTDQSGKGKQAKAKGEKQAGENEQGAPASNDQGKKGDKSGSDGAKGQKTGADKKQGEGPEKTAAGGKGGNPQGPMKTEKADEPQPGAGAKGEKKEPGMGKTGDSGAGDASKDEKGSGDNQEVGRDTKKEMSPDSTQPGESEPSTPSGSKKQSDSQGNDSGDRSGGGKKGAGQSTKQAGNDSAGSNNAGDEGAGAAKEKGQGDTGKQGGDQQKAAGQTGAKGTDKGDGSSGKEGQGKGAGGGPMQPDGKPSDNQSEGGKDSQGKGSSGPIVGGGNQDQRPPPVPGVKGVVPDGDEANLEYAKKQTELALQHLKEQEHNPDPELLDRLGWTKEELQEFLRRWEAMQKAAAEDSQASHELDESLKSLGLKPAINRKRTERGVSDNNRDLRDSGTRTSAPKSYRDQFDNFRKGSR